MPDLTDLRDLGICARCLGRIFASVGESMDNATRGNMLIFSTEGGEDAQGFLEADSKECRFCSGIFSDLGRYYNIVEYELAGTEYNTFLMGSVFDVELLREEQELEKRMGGLGESLKKEFNREFGKYYSRMTGKDVSFTDPDVSIIVDTRYDFAKCEIRSIYIRGRYNKFRRDLPQTRWIHQPGNNESVEYFIGKHALELCGGDNYFLHAAGREDVDVKMLGKGRDFVLEVTRPSKRKIELSVLEDAVNSGDSGVKVNTLEFCSREYVKEVKSTTYDKTYRVVVSSESDLAEERLKTALRNITGKVIYQRTPLRVAVRRADLVRERSLRESALEEFQGKEATILVRAESGMYIKELINGDEGRTNPSLSSEYGDKLTVIQLDVVEINRGN